jgi:hypothetical protein
MRSNEYPGLIDPPRECGEQLDPFCGLMSQWQGRYRPFSPEWSQISRLVAEARVLRSLLCDRPRPAPFERFERRPAEG